MRINHKLFRHTRIELAIALRRVIQADDLHAGDFSNVDAAPMSRAQLVAIIPNTSAS
jgi:hypothetical protein